MNERVMSGLELAQSLATVCTRMGVPVSQVAVLMTVALRPGSSGGRIEHLTGMSKQNVSKVVSYLRETGDLQFVKRPGNAKVWFLTAQGVRLVKGYLRAMRWSERGRFGVVELPEERRNIWEL